MSDRTHDELVAIIGHLEDAHTHIQALITAPVYIGHGYGRALQQALLEIRGMLYTYKYELKKLENPAWEIPAGASAVKLDA